jgi:hypothetical protein
MRAANSGLKKIYTSVTLDEAEENWDLVLSQLQIMFADRAASLAMGNQGFLPMFCPASPAPFLDFVHFRLHRILRLAGGSATNKHAPGLYRRISCPLLPTYILTRL